MTRKCTKELEAILTKIELAKLGLGPQVIIQTQRICDIDIRVRRALGLDY